MICTTPQVEDQNNLRSYEGELERYYIYRNVQRQASHSTHFPNNSALATLKEATNTVNQQL